ncbi:SAM-dependent methyltransferase [Novipirellula artificiosorum]|uniref:Putative 23S rRNA ribose 2'-O-ribose methyltransferase n=1 Tax=Novipirellula artificiosorum TaxID=2528016 RepID=A0A5C6E1Z7_9BACT|nr:SAM-dependent methyltransferase [Novipirellula artificiosorum]TWU42514.1 putative 23S rRNA ribose 2'-O-ribose methyltransferase [Novipirellula artificiosorum]
MNAESTPGPTFTMICCAHGAEPLVKESIAGEGWRLAFSRPGFVTAKHDERVPTPSGTFIRTAATSIGQARSPNASELLESLRKSLADHYPAEHRFDQLHVWPKDRAPIGRFDFEPGVDEVSRAVAAEIYAALSPDHLRCDAANRVAQPGERVLDVVLVEPAHWFFGTHVASTWPTRWPGGIQPMDLAEEPVSRAYYKAAEAIQWSGFPIQRGDLAAEIGAAPGGACGRLLELGLKVIGIDPAEMDPRISEHPHFRYIQARAGDLPRKDFRGVKWILVDSNVKPEQTLVTVGNIVTSRYSDVRGLLITLKLGDYKAAKKIDQWQQTVETWNPKAIQVRQLARNRCEVCFAVRMK